MERILQAIGFAALAAIAIPSLIFAGLLVFSRLILLESNPFDAISYLPFILIGVSVFGFIAGFVIRIREPQQEEKR